VSLWEITFTPRAIKSLNQLPEKVGAATLELIFGPLTQSPEIVGKPLRFELEGSWSARRGDYRVIYAINHATSEVIIQLIEHRSDVYRRS